MDRFSRVDQFCTFSKIIYFFSRLLVHYSPNLLHVGTKTSSIDPLKVNAFKNDKNLYKYLNSNNQIPIEICTPFITNFKLFNCTTKKPFNFMKLYKEVKAKKKTLMTTKYTVQQLLEGFNCLSGCIFEVVQLCIFL